MPTLNPEQEALKIAAQQAIDRPTALPFFRSQFDKLTTPETVLALLAQLEGSSVPGESFSEKELSAIALELIAASSGGDGDDGAFADGRSAGITALYTAIKKRMSGQTTPTPVQPGQAVEGWKFVPIEMTTEMLEAAARAANGWWSRKDAGNAYRLWPAILAAAPAFEGTIQ